MVIWLCHGSCPCSQNLVQHWLVLIDETMYHWKPLKICHCKLKCSKKWYELGKSLWDCVLGLMCLPSSPVQAWLCVWLLFFSILLQVLMKQSCWNQGNHREENLLRDVLCESYFFFWEYILAKMYAFRRLRFYCQCFTSFFHSEYMNAFSLSRYHTSLFLGILSDNLFLFSTQPPLTAVSQLVH